MNNRQVAAIGRKSAEELSSGLKEWRDIYKNSKNKNNAMGRKIARIVQAYYNEQQKRIKDSGK